MRKPFFSDNLVKFTNLYIRYIYIYIYTSKILYFVYCLSYAQFVAFSIFSSKKCGIHYICICKKKFLMEFRYFVFFIPNNLFFLFKGWCAQIQEIFWRGIVILLYMHGSSFVLIFIHLCSLSNYFLTFSYLFFCYFIPVIMSLQYFWNTQLHNGSPLKFKPNSTILFYGLSYISWII